MTSTEQAPVTRQAVRAFLDGLAKPRTPLDLVRRPHNRLARNLHRQGITGHRDRAEACPIANALGREFPGHDWKVWGSTIEDGVRVLTPQPVRRFILRFDRGDYPQLEATDGHR